MSIKVLIRSLLILFFWCQQIGLSQDSVVTAKNDSLVESIEPIFERLSEDLSRQNSKNQMLIKQSEKNFELASRIIDWTAMFFAMLVVFLGIAGWIGTRRFNQIDQTAKEMADLLTKMRIEIDQMEKLKSESQENLKNLNAKIENDRKEMLEILFYSVRGDVAFEKGEIDSAIEFYTKIITLNPNIPESYLMLGNSYSANSDFELAIEYLNKAIDLRKDYYEAYYSLGRVYRRKNEYQIAIKNFERSIQLKPDFVNAIENLGHTYSRMGLNEEALECFHRTIAIDPKHTVSYTSIAILYYKQGDFEKATNYCNIARKKLQHKIKDEKYRYWDLYDMVQICLMLNQISEAEKYLMEATKLNSARATLLTFIKSFESLKNSPNPPADIDNFIQILTKKLT